MDKDDLRFVWGLVRLVEKGIQEVNDRVLTLRYVLLRKGIITHQEWEAADNHLKRDREEEKLDPEMAGLVIKRLATDPHMAPMAQRIIMGLLEIDLKHMGMSEEEIKLLRTDPEKLNRILDAMDKRTGEEG